MKNVYRKILQENQIGDDNIFVTHYHGENGPLVLDSLEKITGQSSVSVSKIPPSMSPLNRSSSSPIPVDELENTSSSLKTETVLSSSGQSTDSEDTDSSQENTQERNSGEESAHGESSSENAMLEGSIQTANVAEGSVQATGVIEEMSAEIIIEAAGNPTHPQFGAVVRHFTRGLAKMDKDSLLENALTNLAMANGISLLEEEVNGLCSVCSGIKAYTFNKKEPLSLGDLYLRERNVNNPISVNADYMPADIVGISFLAAILSFITNIEIMVYSKSFGFGGKFSYRLLHRPLNSRNCSNDKCKPIYSIINYTGSMPDQTIQDHRKILQENQIGDDNIFVTHYDENAHLIMDSLEWMTGQISDR